MSKNSKLYDFLLELLREGSEGVEIDQNQLEAFMIENEGAPMDVLMQQRCLSAGYIEEGWFEPNGTKN